MPSVKEFGHASKFDQCFIPATEAEQLLPNFGCLATCLAATGIPHFHFGATRLAVTFVVEKGYLLLLDLNQLTPGSYNISMPA